LKSKKSAIGRDDVTGLQTAVFKNPHGSLFSGGRLQPEVSAFLPCIDTLEFLVFLRVRPTWTTRPLLFVYRYGVFGRASLALMLWLIAMLLLALRGSR
jgi:hypothetical protein